MNIQDKHIDRDITAFMYWLPGATWDYNNNDWGGADSQPY